MRFLGLVLALVVGSSLARSFDDPVPSVIRAFEQSRSYPFESRGPDMWLVAPDQESADSTWINGIGWVEPGRSC